MSMAISGGFSELVRLARQKLALTEGLLSNIRALKESLPSGETTELFDILERQRSHVDEMKRIDLLYESALSAYYNGAAFSENAPERGILLGVLGRQRDLIRQIRAETDLAKSEIVRLSLDCRQKIVKTQKEKSVIRQGSDQTLSPGSLLNYSEESRFRLKKS